MVQFTVQRLNEAYGQYIEDRTIREHRYILPTPGHMLLG